MADPGFFHWPLGQELRIKEEWKMGEHVRSNRFRLCNQNVQLAFFPVGVSEDIPDPAVVLCRSLFSIGNPVSFKAHGEFKSNSEILKSFVMNCTFEKGETTHFWILKSHDGHPVVERLVLELPDLIFCMIYEVPGRKPTPNLRQRIFGASPKYVKLTSREKPAKAVRFDLPLQSSSATAQGGFWVAYGGTSSTFRSRESSSSRTDMVESSPSYLSTLWSYIRNFLRR